MLSYKVKVTLRTCRRTEQGEVAISFQRPPLHVETVQLVEFGDNEYFVEITHVCSVTLMIPCDHKQERVEKCHQKKICKNGHYQGIQPSWFAWDCLEFSIETFHVPGNHPLLISWRLQGSRRHLLPDDEWYHWLAPHFPCPGIVMVGVTIARTWPQKRKKYLCGVSCCIGYMITKSTKQCWY